MRFALPFILLVSSAASAQDLSLADVRDARNWTLEVATCREVIALFIDPSRASDISDKQSASLLFFTTYLQAISAERNVPYGELLLQVDAYCDENPSTTWLAFH